MNYSGFKVRDLKFDSKEKYIRCISDMWYFLDERGTLVGPLKTKEETESKLIEYINYLEDKHEKQAKESS